MNGKHDASLSTLIATAKAITEQVTADFSDYSAPQLNWKPGADSWSIAQCFEHLITANESYFPTFEEVVQGETKRSLWHRLPGLAALCGRMMIAAVSPGSRRMQAPEIFHPTSSHVDEAIVHRFIDQQERLIHTMRATEHLDPAKIIIPSPAIKLIPYSLLDAYRLIVAHEERHLLQAKRVSEIEAFPR